MKDVHKDALSTRAQGTQRKDVTPHTAMPYSGINTLCWKGIHIGDFGEPHEANTSEWKLDGLMTWGTT